jgi:DNA-binding transcriptional MerR regulator
MEPSRRKPDLPPIPAKRYFTIGEVSDLCGVKPHVLRYWEQEFTQLKPVKRRGNRRYYQHHEVLLIRRIRELLYEEGFTISGARNRLDTARSDTARLDNGRGVETTPVVVDEKIEAPVRNGRAAPPPPNGVDVAAIKRELRAVLDQLQR